MEWEVRVAFDSHDSIICTDSWPGSAVVDLTASVPVFPKWWFKYSMHRHVQQMDGKLNIKSIRVWGERGTEIGQLLHLW